MKLNLFSGMLIFEGTQKDFNHVIEKLPELKDKMIAIQQIINDTSIDYLTRQSKINKTTTGLSV
jgi:hypothetical protein